MTLNWVPVTNRFPWLLGVLDSKGCQYELRRWKTDVCQGSFCDAPVVEGHAAVDQVLDLVGD